MYVDFDGTDANIHTYKCACPFCCNLIQNSISRSHMLETE